MDEISIDGVDLTKQVFQIHGAKADGRAVFRTKLSRPQFAKFMATVPRCIVAISPNTASFWARASATSSAQTSCLEENALPDVVRHLGRLYRDPTGAVCWPRRYGASAM